MNCQTVLITKTCRGSADGVKCRRYYSGRQYDLPSNLVKVFIEDLKVAVIPPTDAPLNSSPANDGVIAGTVGNLNLIAKVSQQPDPSPVITPPWANKTKNKNRK